MPAWLPAWHLSHWQPSDWPCALLHMHVSRTGLQPLPRAQLCGASSVEVGRTPLQHQLSAAMIKLSCYASMRIVQTRYAYVLGRRRFDTGHERYPWIGTRSKVFAHRVLTVVPSARKLHYQTPTAVTPIWYLLDLASKFCRRLAKKLTGSWQPSPAARD